MPPQTGAEPDYPLLSQVDLPADLRRLDEARLPQLASELRRFLIASVSKTGGHLAAGLGVVELSVALHYVFDTPDDRLVWDVGHQAYPHKILTGRRRAMETLRQSGGLSGFLRRDESPYDAFGAGHSSTSISAALGMAAAAKQLGERRHAVAVIGDGALTAGMAFEALNHAGALDLDLLVILNDNDMSISPPVGALSKYLTRVLTSRFYTSVREGSKSVLNHMPPGFRELMGRWEEHMKGMVMPGTLFEELGFNYVGPIDGHDLPLLISTLRNLNAMPGPRFLHLVTQKGKGYTPAEADPCGYHGVSPFDPAAGKRRKGAVGPSYSQVFGDWLCEVAERDPRLVAVTPAMCEGSGMVDYARRFPGRYFDVGIAEQHAVTFAAGLACEAVKPVVAIYSTFLQRAFDQLAHDVSLQDLDLTLAVDRAGLVGADGATHAGSFDLGYARLLPNLLVAAPSDENECRRLLQTAYEYPGPALVRYPRGSGPGAAFEPGLAPLPIGEGEVRRRGRELAILSFGSLLPQALQAAAELDATVADMRFVKPLDRALIAELAETHRLLVTLEENALAGGAGSAVGELLAELGLVLPMLHLGLPDRYVGQGSHQEQLRECGLDAEGIGVAIRERLEMLGPA